MNQHETDPKTVLDTIRNDESVVIVVRHPKHTDNVIDDEQAERVRSRGRQIHSYGMSPDQVVAAVSSKQPRSAQTARLLLEGIGSSNVPVIQNHTINAIEEVGGDCAKDFKTAATKAGMKPWVALSEKCGQELVAQHGIPDRLLRASRTAATWAAFAQMNLGKAVVISDHNGYDIEPAVSYLLAQAQGITMTTADDLPNPDRYLNEAGVIIIRFDHNGIILYITYVDGEE